MKKLLLTSLAAFCLGSFAFAQDGAKVAQKKKATPVAAKAKAPSLTLEVTSQESRQKAKELDFQKQHQATAPQQQRKNALAAEKVER